MSIFRFDGRPHNHSRLLDPGSGTRTRRVGRLVFLIAASMVAGCPDSQAAGSIQTKPAFPSGATTGVSRQPGTSVPKATSSDFLNGCSETLADSGSGTFETCRPALNMSSMGKPEVAGPTVKRRFLTIVDIERVLHHDTSSTLTDQLTMLADEPPWSAWKNYNVFSCLCRYHEF
jgi:hypothetical protein